jgi:hypothetical protein
MLKEDFRMLGLRAVARIGAHDELSIWEMLGEEERVDRQDDDVLVSMDRQRRMMDLAQHRKTVLLGDDAPFPDGRQLSDGRRLRHRCVAINDAELEPLDIGLDIGAPRGLTRLALSEECLHEQADFVVQLFYREIVEDHSFTTARPRAEHCPAPPRYQAPREGVRRIWRMQLVVARSTSYRLILSVRPTSIRQTKVTPLAPSVHPTSIRPPIEHRDRTP